MDEYRLMEGVAHAGRDFYIEICTRSEALRIVYCLRYQVYCVERRFEPGQDGQETDAHDAASRHVLLWHRPSATPIGTVRLVLPRLNGGPARLPIEEVADLPRLRTVPRAGLAEVSRFALSKALRAASASLGSLARLALVRGIVQLSGELELTHWCALMEPGLLRLLAGSGIHFQPAGGMVEHHGLRQPAVAALDDMLERVRQERPCVWEFLTEAGAFWPARPAAAA